MQEKPKIDQLSATYIKHLFPSMDYAPEWLAQNISSIQEALKNEEQIESMFYPACGIDVIRVILAYRPKHIIAADLDDLLPHIEETFSAMHIPWERTDMGLRINLTDVQVTLEYIRDDAREVFSRLDSLDGYYVALPTGATSPYHEMHMYMREHHPDNYSPIDEYFPQEFTSEEGAPTMVEDENGDMRYKPVFSGIKEEINGELLQRITLGGVLSFADSTRLPLAPQGFWELLGLEEKQITRRHPLLISTNMYPDIEALVQQEKADPEFRNGSLYIKRREVDPEVVNSLLAAVDALDYPKSILESIQKGRWAYMRWILGPESDEDELTQIAGIFDETRRSIDSCEYLTDEQKEEMYGNLKSWLIEIEQSLIK